MTDIHTLIDLLLRTCDDCEVHSTLMAVEPPSDEHMLEWWHDNVTGGAHRIVALDYDLLARLREAADEWRFRHG